MIYGEMADLSFWRRTIVLTESNSLGYSAMTIVFAF